MSLSETTPYSNFQKSNFLKEDLPICTKRYAYLVLPACQQEVIGSLTHNNPNYPQTWVKSFGKNGESFIEVALGTRYSSTNGQTCVPFSTLIDRTDPYRIRVPTQFGCHSPVAYGNHPIALLSAQIRRKWGRHGQVDGGGRMFFHFVVISTLSSSCPFVRRPLVVSHNDPNFDP